FSSVIKENMMSENLTTNVYPLQNEQDYEKEASAMTQKESYSANGQPDTDLTGVINPYALAELVLGRTIEWGDIADPRSVLEDVLATPYEHLFDPVFDSPLYMGLRLKDDLTLERVRPAVLDIEHPQSQNDLERYSFGDTRSLKKISDLGPYFDIKDTS